MRLAGQIEMQHLLAEAYLITRSHPILAGHVLVGLKGAAVRLRASENVRFDLA